MSHYIAPLETPINIASSQIEEYCVPILTDCGLFDDDDDDGVGILAPVDENGNCLTYNCKKCSWEPVYYTPFVRGDRIMIQTPFIDNFNADPQNPTQGYGTWLDAEMILPDGSSVNPSAFTVNWLAGWTGTKSYQLLEIDTNFGIDCFVLKITANSPSGDTDAVCTQQFQRVECEEDTVLVRSYFDSCQDGLRYFYGEPESFVSFTGEPFAYNNQMRYWGRLRKMPGQFSKEIYADKVISRNIRQEYKLVLNKRFPSYVNDMLMSQHLFGDYVEIDGKKLYIDSIAPSNKLTKGNLFLYDVSLYQKIEQNCC